MQRYKTFDATGVAPGGRLYAGDLNAIQDATAGLNDLTQNLSVSSLAIGEPGLVLSRFAAGQAQLSGALVVNGATINGAGTGTLYAPSCDVRSTADVYVSAQGTGRVVLRNLTAGAVISMDSTGKLLFSYSDDTNLYRNGAADLKTDSRFRTALDFNARDGAVTQVKVGDAVGAGVAGTAGIALGSSQDVKLWRAAAGNLKTDSSLFTYRQVDVLNAVGDTQPAVRLYVASAADGDQRLYFGVGGTTAPDTMLYRASAGTLQTNGNFRASQSIVVDQLSAGWKLYFGGAQDVSLYRQQAGVLRTDGSFRVGSYLDVDLGGTGASLRFGSASDTNLYRAAAGVLKTDTAFITAGNFSVLLASGDTQAQIVLSRNLAGVGLPGINFGPGGSTTPDTNLYRYGADLLATDDQFFTMKGTGAQIRLGSNSGVPTIWFGNSGGDSGDTTLYRAAANSLRTDGNFSAGATIQSTGYMTVDYGNTGARLYFGSAADTGLYRGSPGNLVTDNAFTVNSSFTVGSGGEVFLDRSNTTRHIWWGTSNDTNLWRSGVATLQTDGHFNIGGDVVLLNAGSRIRMANYSGASVSGSYVGKFPVYTVAGALIGYVPIYQS